MSTSDHERMARKTHECGVCGMGARACEGCKPARPIQMHKQRLPDICQCCANGAAASPQELRGARGRRTTTLTDTWPEHEYVETTHQRPHARCSVADLSHGSSMVICDTMFGALCERRQAKRSRQPAANTMLCRDPDGIAEKCHPNPSHQTPTQCALRVSVYHSFARRAQA